MCIFHNIQTINYINSKTYRSKLPWMYRLVENMHTCLESKKNPIFASMIDNYNALLCGHYTYESSPIPSKLHVQTVCIIYIDVRTQIMMQTAGEHRLDFHAWARTAVVDIDKPSHWLRVKIFVGEIGWNETFWSHCHCTVPSRSLEFWMIWKTGTSTYRVLLDVITWYTYIEPIILCTIQL